jgi:replicative DNA helicase
MNTELVQYEVMAKEILRRCMAEDDPEDLFKFISEMLAHLGAGDDTAALTWLESFEFSEKMLEEYARIAATPESERKLLTFPWQSWNNLIDPLEPGMLGLVTAPDGQGKTIYAESIAEHWAMHKNKVVFVHYELNRKLMMLRRIARHTMIQTRDMKNGKLTSEQMAEINLMRKRLESWDGYITYLHTPGWSMEKTVSELRRLHSEGNCDVVVFDYLEKASASKRQLQMFGSNLNAREADNVEQLKTFAELTEAPVFMVAQMTKEAKGTSFAKVDRTGIRGAGEKSDKSNLVILLKRERKENGYSPEVEVFVDKNTMGSTGAFKQYMQPEYFRVHDYTEPIA